MKNLLLLLFTPPILLNCSKQTVTIEPSATIDKSDSLISVYGFGYGNSKNGLSQSKKVATHNVTVSLAKSIAPVNFRYFYSDKSIKFASNFETTLHSIIDDTTIITENSMFKIAKLNNAIKVTETQNRYLESVSLRLDSDLDEQLQNLFQHAINSEVKKDTSRDNSGEETGVLGKVVVTNIKLVEFNESKRVVTMVIEFFVELQ